MHELSIFQQEEELLEFGNRFMEAHDPAATQSTPCPPPQDGVCTNRTQLYAAFKRVFTQYKKLFKQTTRLIRLSDRQQLKLDNTNQSLKESQRKLERSNTFIRTIFSRYMSDEVVESILETPEGLRMGGEKKEVTVMMSDLRGFTAISETLPPETVVTIINLYLEVMTEIIFTYQGTINSFLGDGIMILFGAPIAREDDTKRAIACALEMQRVMPDINRNNKALGYPELQMGIGIHTGQVVAGNIGSQKRSHYTVMGKVVNLAARVESYSVGGQILISEQTREACHPLLQIDDSMEVHPKGVEHPITLHQVSAIGAPYHVCLAPQAKIVYHTLAEAIPIQFAVLTGKHAGTLDHAGEIASLSSAGIKIKTDTPITQFANMTMALYHQGCEIAQGLSGKVIRGTSDEHPLIEMAFTFVPDVVQTFFKNILDTDASPPQQPPPASAPPEAQPVVDPKPEAAPVKTRNFVRRRHAKPIALHIALEDGSVVHTTIGDFSLDGMFLHTDAQKPPASGTRGSFEIPCQDTVHRFSFEVVHAYQSGIGLRITQDHDIYAMALLDGAFGTLFPVETP